MDTRELAKIDLNLLISLKVLIEENSVSKAADRLFITQPAMSKTLSRLRRVFNDPLFTRSSHGMQPTPRAGELAADLGNILEDIQQLVSGTRFDPATYSGEVTLAVSEYVGVALLPGLARELALQAPGLSIKVVTRVENQLEQLALGKLDFAIQMAHAHYGNEFRVQQLGGSPPALLMRDSHPLSRGKISWRRLSGFPLIRLYIADQEQTEIHHILNRSGRLLDSPLGSWETSHLLTALEILRSTDYVMPGPAFIMQNTATAAGICAHAIPDGANYTINYALVTHNRTLNSALHNWLWEQITCTIRQLRTPLPGKLRQRIAAGSTDPIQ